ncbi:MAG: redoxin domain-containing protein [Actinomycetota bacterium]|nr:redoxin domain-containing protein [Actinomycetota bacterium]
MDLLAPGSDAPGIDGVELGSEPRALFFYKVTCPVCQMAAPKAQAMEEAYPGTVVGIGEDPPDALAAFGEQYGMALPSVTDEEPFPASDSYGISSVPTLFLVDVNGVIEDVVQSWDRQGFNRVSARLAELTGSPYVEISDAADGLPSFRPG